MIYHKTQNTSYSCLASKNSLIHIELQYSMYYTISYYTILCEYAYDIVQYYIKMNLFC